MDKTSHTKLEEEEDTKDAEDKIMAEIQEVLAEIEHSPLKEKSKIG